MGSVSNTRSELEKTIANLTKVTGDLGVQSGYIATNGKELDALKRLGERNYFEFNLGKTKTPTRVGDIMVMLKKTDPKKNRYTIEVTVDDQVVEKKSTDPLFKEIVESQMVFAKRVTQWEQDTVVNRRMAYNHYFGPNAKKKT